MVWRAVTTQAALVLKLPSLRVRFVRRLEAVLQVRQLLDRPAANLGPATQVLHNGMNRRVANREGVLPVASRERGGSGLNKQEALEARNRAVGDAWVAKMMAAQQQGA